MNHVPPTRKPGWPPAGHIVPVQALQGRTAKLVLTRIDGTLLLVPFAEVIRLEADGAYTRVHLVEEREHCLSKGLGEVFKNLAHNNLPIARTHRSHAINLDHLTAVHRHGKKQWLAQLNGQHVVPVAHTMHQAFRDHLARFHVMV